MKYENGDIFTLGENNYMVTETSLFMGIDYLLLNKLDETEEPTNEIFIYKVVEDGLVKITDPSILEVILPIFTNKLQKNIADILAEEKFNIN